MALLRCMLLKRRSGVKADVGDSLRSWERNINYVMYSCAKKIGEDLVMKQSSDASVFVIGYVIRAQMLRALLSLGLEFEVCFGV